MGAEGLLRSVALSSESESKFDSESTSESELTTQTTRRWGVVLGVVATSRLAKIETEELAGMGPTATESCEILPEAAAGGGWATGAGARKI
jgi:hypothetical protein